uniref:Uncharacterized protein n=1 Tax=Meloidogyne javanica TaxID=6303 RepID=A0A915LQ54_MELJA
MYSNNVGYRKSVSETDSSSETSSNTSSNLSSVVLARQQELPFSYDTETGAGPSMAQADWNNNNNRFDDSDFRIVFSLSIIVLEQNKSVGEMSIRNLLLSQIGVLEGLINQTNIDRNRVVVKEIN